MSRIESYDESEVGVREDDLDLSVDVTTLGELQSSSSELS